MKILILSTYEGMDANAVRDYLLSFRLHSRQQRRVLRLLVFFGRGHLHVGAESPLLEINRPPRFGRNAERLFPLGRVFQ